MALVKETRIGPLRLFKQEVDGSVVLEVTDARTRARYQVEISASKGLVLERRLALDGRGINEENIGTGHEFNQLGGIALGFFGLRRLFWDDETAVSAKGSM